MDATPMGGALIAFEGLDQSGKETQVRHLQTRLETSGRRVDALAFPDYTTPIAQEIAAALRGAREYPADVLQLLFVTNRYEYRRCIEDWVSRGDVVLCDRYLASSIAYGEAQGLDPEWLASAQRFLPQPDLTIFLDISPESAVRRKAAGRDLLEHDLALQSRARASYLRQAAQPSWCRVNGEADVDTVAHEVAAIVKERLHLP